MEEKAPSPPSPDTQVLGKVMVISAWVLALLLLMLFFDRWSSSHYANTNPKVVTINGEEKTVLQRNYQNQYLVKGSINGKPVVFLLDTGASDVVVSSKLAKELNLIHGPQAIAGTAGEDITVFQTRIKELIIGNIVLHNVGASINPSMKREEVLLGMTALKKITFHQEGDQLILSISK